MSSVLASMSQSRGYFVVSHAPSDTQNGTSSVAKDATPLVDGVDVFTYANSIMGNTGANMQTYFPVGAVLKDMGKTVRIDNEVYRKVQLVNQFDEFTSLYIRLPSVDSGLVGANGLVSRFTYVPNLGGL